MSSEGAPQRRQEEETHHIPGVSEENSYEKKVAALRNVEALIKADEELEKKIRVDESKGLPLPIAEKMLKDTIARLAENRKEWNRMMGITVQ